MKKIILALTISAGLILAGCSDSSDDANGEPEGSGEFSVSMTGDWSGSTNLNYAVFGFFEDTEDDFSAFTLVAANEDPTNWDNEFETASEYTFIFYREGDMIGQTAYTVGNMFDTEMDDGDLPEGEFGVVIYRFTDNGFQMAFSESGTITFNSVSGSNAAGTFAVDFKAMPFTFDEEETQELEFSATGQFNAASGLMFIDF